MPEEWTSSGAGAGGMRGGGRKGAGGAPGGANGPAAGAAPVGRKRAASARSSGPDLKKELRDFASARPNGWSHDDWLNFLEDLRERGHNINDREAIGLALEKERLDLALSGIRGVGPQRRLALVNQFGNLWKLRNASAGEIASAGNLPGSLAERIREELQH